MTTRTRPYLIRDRDGDVLAVVRHCSGPAHAIRAYHQRLGLTAHVASADDAIAAWNTRAALAAEQPQPEAQPVAVVTECEACFTPDVCQLRGKCDHYSTDWLRVAPPPSAPAPSEAEVAAAMASLYRAMEPAAWPSEDEVTDALRAAAAARNTNPA